MTRYCECGNKIMIYQKGKGLVPPPDREHDLCNHCWQNLLDAVN